MRAKGAVAVVLGVTSLVAGQVRAQVLKGSKFDVPQPFDLPAAMRTSFGRVLPPGRYSLEVSEAPGGTMNLLFFDARHALIGLTKALFQGPEAIAGAAQASAAYSKGTNRTGPQVLDKTSPPLVGSTAADKWKFNGEPASQVQHKEWSPQWGGKAPASGAELPPGLTFARLGFGVNSRARFENNAIIIVGGGQVAGEIVAALTPAGR